jgi:hypothetical protein
MGGTGRSSSWLIGAVDVDEDLVLAHPEDDGFIRFGAGISLAVDHALGDEDEIARPAHDTLGAAVTRNSCPISSPGPRRSAPGLASGTRLRYPVVVRVVNPRRWRMRSDTGHRQAHR